MNPLMNPVGSNAEGKLNCINAVVITHLVEPKKISTRKTQKFQLFRPIGTQCVIGVQSVRAKARRKLKYMSLRLAFYIRVELDRSNVDGRSFQAHSDKMLYFQGLYGFTENIWFF